jgi:transitional endoplasmic reticulum ATPase
LRINRSIRSNLRVRPGDAVSVSICTDIQFGKRIHVLPIGDSTEGMSEESLKCLRDFFLDGDRPVHEGNTLIAQSIIGALDFKVSLFNLIIK